MIRDNEGDINYDAWYSGNKDYIPEPMKKDFEDCFEIMHFMYGVYRKVMRQLAPALLKLMWQQYPVFKTERRPLVVKHIKAISTTTGYTLLFNLYHLVQDQKSGVDVREKCPELDSLVDFYARPQHPDTINETKRYQYTWLNDEEWEVHRDHENSELLIFFNWKEKRKFEFVDLVQKLLFKYYKELEELNADEWILYAVHIREEYEAYLCGCEDVELFIDCGFPEEEIKLSDEEFRQNVRKLSLEIRDKTDELRNRRIAGERI